jgi:cobaltochelatase CobT
MARYGETVDDYHIGKSSPAFVSQMRRLLQVRSAAHYDSGHKSGKLARSRVWRVGLPPIDHGDWNARIFKKKTQLTDLMDTAILLLCDGSGSMSGSKFQTTAKAAALCNDAFARVLHVPLSVVAFTSSGSTPVLGVVKEFTETVSDDQVAERFHDFSSYMSGNNDADSLLWCYEKIKTHHARRKIIIVLSDGSPADGIGDPYTALKMVTQRILDEKRVDLYGIGIMDTNVRNFYPKNRVINSIGELEPALVEVMGKAFMAD